MTENSYKKHNSTSFRPKLSLWHFVIEPVISYGKSIDVMRLNEYYITYIFMNINKNVKNRGKMRKESKAIAKF